MVAFARESIEISKSRGLVALLVTLALVILGVVIGRRPSEATSVREFALVSSPSAEALVVARTNGLYRSTDQGQSWHRVGPSDFIPTGLAVAPLVVQPLATVQAPPIIYAAGEDGAVLRSADGGLDWSAVDLPLAAEGPLALSVVPQTHGLLAASRGGHLFRSQDGKTWHMAPRNGLSPVLQTLAVDPAAPGVLYGFSSQGEMWRSRDDGFLWNVISPEKAPSIRALVVRKGGTQGAAVHFGCACGGAAAGDTTSIVFVLQGDHLFRSFDQGESWGDMATSGLQPAEMATLTVDPVNYDILYATRHHQGGAYRSLDAGSTWRPLRGD